MRNCLDTDIDPLKNVLGKIPICFITYFDHKSDSEGHHSTTQKNSLAPRALNSKAN